MDLGRLTARSLIAAVAGWTAAAGLEGGATAHACCAQSEGAYFDVEQPRNTLVRVLGLDVVSRFVVERDVDVSPPDFAGVTAATFRQHAFGTEVEITHHPLPLDVAFIVVSARRPGPGRIGSRQMLGFREGVMGDHRDLTVLSSYCDFADAPPMEVGATYCVSVAALDAAGNASGGDVEVCSPVIGPPPDPDEVQLKEVTLPVWASPRLRSRASVVAVLVLFAAWRWRRRRRPSVLRWGR